MKIKIIKQNKTNGFMETNLAMQKEEKQRNHTKERKKTKTVSDRKRGTNI